MAITGDGKTVGSTSTENAKTGNNSETYSMTRTGLNGSRTYSQLINEYREAITNIDMQILNDPEITDLFMKIY